MNSKKILWYLFMFISMFSSVKPLYSQQIAIPTVNFNIAQAKTPQEVSLALQILFLLTIISLAPSLLILMTSFIRIYIVLSFVGRGIGTQNLPPTQTIAGLSLFLTLFVMFPILKESYQSGLQPYFEGKISINEGYTKSIAPIRKFMFQETSERYIYRFIQLAHIDRPRNQDDVPTYVLIPAFVLNEISIAFYMGVLIMIPFTIIDIITAGTLMSMGMMMVPPVTISFPIKILLFVLADGWDLLVDKLIQSFLR
ncbi:MAG: flagellar type III secretion system pore protein FliP [Brevinemataceae bacterium]